MDQILMPESSNSPPAVKPDKPKRKYTVSDKVLAANRAKLVQANADPRRITVSAPSAWPPATLTA
jgi:hypothetical protein